MNNATEKTRAPRSSRFFILKVAIQFLSLVSPELGLGLGLSAVLAPVFVLVLVLLLVLLLVLRLVVVLFPVLV